ncbi:MAG: metallophosphatase domain-containing protein [Acidobacteriota bacterium]|nr:metallophosphatase domain-containing protein [Acidobacteriota bacterium]
MKFVCLSDTHNQHRYLNVPDGDVLIHAGDFCGKGTLNEAADFAEWLKTLPHRHKVVIAGNHDFPFERNPKVAEPLLAHVTYLRDAAVTIEGIKIYGAPWQPYFHSWAFNVHRGEPIRKKWRLIPDDTDILVTHGPMYGAGDETSVGKAVGCEDLRDEVLNRVKPRRHVCGHIHEGRGIYQVGETISINACSLDVRYRPHPETSFVFEWGP